MHRNTNSRSRTLRTRGFTLIELLVVIAIIAILAAILLPVFAKTRQKAYQASCQSNLKQIAFAILAYADDHDGYGPVSQGMGCFSDVSTGTTTAGGACNSALALRPYDAGWADYYEQPGPPGTVSNWSINPLWLCKGTGTGTYKMLYSRGGTWHKWEPQGGSYGAGSGGGRVRNTSRAALVGDAWAYTAMTADPPKPVYGYWWHFILPRDENDVRSSPGDYSSMYYKRYWNSLAAHNGGNNMAFCDGHVKWLSAQSMLSDMDWWVSAFQ